MKENKIRQILDVAFGKLTPTHYCIHIDYKTKIELRRTTVEEYFGYDIGRDVIVEHFTPLVKTTLSHDEEEIAAKIEWEREHPEIMRMYRRDWKEIDAAREAVEKSGHILHIDEGINDVYKDMPYYQLNKHKNYP
jgi:hypothetical protein